MKARVQKETNPSPQLPFEASPNLMETRQSQAKRSDYTMTSLQLTSNGPVGEIERSICSTSCLTSLEKFENKVLEKSARMFFIERSTDRLMNYHSPVGKFPVVSRPHKKRPSLTDHGIVWFENNVG
jgi:hypothetical protein